MLGQNSDGVDYTVKSYVDDKVADVVAGSIDGLGALAAKDVVTDAELDATLKEKIDAASSTASEVKTLVGTLPATGTEATTVIGYVDEKTAAAAYDDTELAGRVTVVGGQVATLVGDDTGKSVRTIANEELAAQLIPETAKESLDTLAEIAAWIQSHPDDASAINAAITSLQNLVGSLPADAASTTVVAYIKEYCDAAISALSIGEYAKAADLTAAVTRIATLEGKAHEHSNKAELDLIVTGDVAKWNAMEQNAKDYSENLLEWGSF